MKALLALAALAAGLTISLTGSPAKAATDPAPELFISSGECFRSIIQADDLYCLTRYELPTNTTVNPGTPELWCKYVLDLDGCTGQPVNPTAPWSLDAGAAYVALYDGSTVLSQTPAPRVGKSLAGMYLPAGHGVTWGATTVNVCVESGTSYFTTQEQSCQPASWTTAANTTTAQRAALATALRSQFINLEVASPLIATGGYVINNRITAAGRDIALEALNVMDRILTGVFQSESSSAAVDFTPSSGLQLQADINATAVAVADGLDGTGAAIGLSGDALGILLFVILGVGAFWVAMRVTGSPPMAVVGFLTMMLAGVPVGAVPLAVAGVAILLIFAVGVLFVLRKSVLS